MNRPPRLPPLIARRLNEFEAAVRFEQVALAVNRTSKDHHLTVARRRRTLTLAIRKAIAAGK